MLPVARKGKDGGEWVDLARERRPPDRAVVHRQGVISCGRAGQGGDRAEYQAGRAGLESLSARQLPS